ncbi:hypothetical protein L6452_21752 [Arctium lappa]|uniref:Uncharacterized protein n=1 Tax=Arctium lappa TaxID=4217 RepID=A0ACB9AY59_ARCLA|nr:hypothetical protein L6452_21752 [Arctium lappa]
MSRLWWFFSAMLLSSVDLSNSDLVCGVTEIELMHSVFWDDNVTDVTHLLQAIDFIRLQILCFSSLLLIWADSVIKLQLERKRVGSQELNIKSCFDFSVGSPFFSTRRQPKHKLWEKVKQTAKSEKIAAKHSDSPLQKVAGHSSRKTELKWDIQVY